MSTTTDFYGALASIVAAADDATDLVASPETCPDGVVAALREASERFRACALLSSTLASALECGADSARTIEGMANGRR